MLLTFLRKAPPAAPVPPPRLAYRLRSWPELPSAFCTADVLRSLSRMSLGPVTSHWFSRKTRLDPHMATRLLDRLVAQGAVERLELMPLPGTRQEYAK